MSIEERRNEVIEFHVNQSKLSWPAATAKPGEVRTVMQIFGTVAEMEEYIEALRRAVPAT